MGNNYISHGKQLCTANKFCMPFLATLPHAVISVVNIDVKMGISFAFFLERAARSNLQLSGTYSMFAFEHAAC
jgi:hypothetical protein